MIRGRVTLLLLLATLAGGCATPPRYTLIESRPTKVLDALSLQPGIAWTAERTGNVERWTVDGVQLESLRFFTGIKDDTPLVASATDDARRPRFHIGMTDPDLMELVVRSLFPSNAAPAELSGARLGGMPGFRFEVRYTAGNGMERRALVAGVVVKERLHVIVYEAAAIHYYARYLPEVERLLGTVRFE
ncbi:MAG: hypothetical protein ACRELS_17760 [Candidatus Rokuibacteriota bacterium]